MRVPKLVEPQPRHLRQAPSRRRVITCFFIGAAVAVGFVVVAPPREVRVLGLLVLLCSVGSGLAVAQWCPVRFPAFLFGLVNFAGTVVPHVLRAPHWAGVMTFGAMGGACMLGALLLPATPRDPTVT